MKLLDMLTLGLLGSAALLPALPSWADSPATRVIAAPAEPAAKPEVQPESSKPDQTVARVDARQAWLDDRRAFLAARLAGLRAGLELTADQEPLFKPVEAALRDFADLRMSVLGRLSGGRDGAALEPQDWLRRRSARLIARGQAMAKLADATGPLLAMLSTAQKDRLPVLLEGLGPRRVIRMAFATPGDRRDGIEDEAVGDPDGGRGVRHHGRRSDHEFDGRQSEGDRDGWRPHRRDREDSADRGRGDRDNMDRDEPEGPRSDRGPRRHHEEDDDTHG